MTETTGRRDNITTNAGIGKGPDGIADTDRTLADLAGEEDRWDGRPGALPQAVIVDMDGTLEDWHGGPNDPGLEYVQWHHAQGRVIVILTARDQSWGHGPTHRWLRRHLGDIPFVGPICRPDGDGRWAADFKRDAYEVLSQLYNIVGAIDDDEHVLEMWRGIDGLEVVATSYSHREGPRIRTVERPRHDSRDAEVRGAGWASVQSRGRKAKGGSAMTTTQPPSSPQDYARACLLRITNEPDWYAQGTWLTVATDEVDWGDNGRAQVSCQTTGCVAGTASMLAGDLGMVTILSDTMTVGGRRVFAIHDIVTKAGDQMSVRSRGKELLGLSEDQANWLFDSCRELPEVVQALTELSEGKPMSCRHVGDMDEVEVDRLTNYRVKANVGGTTQKVCHGQSPARAVAVARALRILRERSGS